MDQLRVHSKDYPGLSRKVECAFEHGTSVSGKSGVAFCPPGQNSLPWLGVLLHPLGCLRVRKRVKVERYAEHLRYTISWQMTISN
jgi:hypothetical protein